MNIAARCREQLYQLALFANSLLYNAIPFFTLKRRFLIAQGNRIGRKSYIHVPVRFLKWGKLTVGDNCTINFGCLLDTRMGIEIGNNVMVGHGCKIYTLGHDLNDPHFGIKGGPVKIHDNAVLFTNVLVMPNVTIHEGAAVMSGSVVTKDVGPWEIVGGNPAKFIKSRSRDIRYKLDHGLWFAN